MKKHVLSVLALVTVAMAASAQTEQGNFLIGGNLNFNTAKEDRRVSVAPSAGYFIIDNLAVGALVNLDYSKVGANKITALSAGPFARYYFGTMNIRPFALGELGFTSSKLKNESNNVSTTETGSNYFLGGGLAAFINRNVALEGIVGYRHTALKGVDGSGGFNLRVGFQIYLTRRQVDALTQ